MWLKWAVEEEGRGAAVAAGGRREEERVWVTGWDGGGRGRGDCRLTSAFPPQEREAPRRLNRILPPHLHQTTCQSHGGSSLPTSLPPSLHLSIPPYCLPRSILHHSSCHQQPRLQNYGGVPSEELTDPFTAMETTLRRTDSGVPAGPWQDP